MGKPCARALAQTIAGWATCFRCWRAGLRKSLVSSRGVIVPRGVGDAVQGPLERYVHSELQGECVCMEILPAIVQALDANSVQTVVAVGFEVKVVARRSIAVKGRSAKGRYSKITS